MSETQCVCMVCGALLKYAYEDDGKSEYTESHGFCGKECIAVFEAWDELEGDMSLSDFYERYLRLSIILPPFED